MDDCASGDLLRPFDKLTDPRAANTVHPFGNILLIAIMAVLCGADDWQNVSRWGKAKAKAKWLATFMDLSAGVPSRDTFRRVLIRMPLGNASSPGQHNWFASRKVD
jgi:hypothetical protein